VRVGVVSDTHGNLANTRKAVAALEQAGVEAVLHCGDIGSEEIVALFDRWPAHFVFGNCDYDRSALEAAIHGAGQTCHGLAGGMDLAGCRTALLHGHEHARFRETIASQAYDLVCYGHTHVAEHHFEGRTLVLNPGALHRAATHTIALVELPGRDVMSVAVS
jgi:putative phosphoesterase